MKGIVLAGGSGTRLSYHKGNIQATDSHFRQTDDLLSYIGFDAGRHTGDSYHLYSL